MKPNGIALSEATEAQQIAGVRRIRDDFHQLYYGLNVLGGPWLGVPTWKCPLDLWIYQEILVEKRPDLVIETGSAHGGSALYLASIMDLIGHGHVVSIDIKPLPRPVSHPRVTFLTGSSVDEETLAALFATPAFLESSRVMVILDSDHAKDHVLRELELYADLVSPGCHLIVEDTNVNGHPVYPEHGPGPWEAVESFLSSRHHAGEFGIDVRRERFLLSFNPAGYLVKL